MISLYGVHMEIEQLCFIIFALYFCLLERFTFCLNTQDKARGSSCVGRLEPSPEHYGRLF